MVNTITFDNVTYDLTTQNGLTDYLTARDAQADRFTAEVL